MKSLLLHVRLQFVAFMRWWTSADIRHARRHIFWAMLVGLCAMGFLVWAYALFVLYDDVALL